MAENEMPKAYDPKAVEDAIYAAWEKSGLFSPLKAGGSKRGVFSIVMPPPNVTGTLHVGHAVMLAIEDIMIRYHRMKGDRTLWVPGTDHAAIATQTKVERDLLARTGKTRHDLGREKFLKEVEKFVQQSKDTIHRQIRKMGASCDWSREAYTMDAPRTLAVRTAFKKMYDDGLIYRGYRIVNWCPRCQSTLADDEVEYREAKTPFYYFKYGPVVIGTARPETKFADKTIVVHSKDPRYKKLHGKNFEVEWIEGKVKANVITDDSIDQGFGTGAMTITPGHDFHDFELAQKHDLPVVPIIDEQGNLTDAAGSFAGKNARASRVAIVAALKKKELVERIDENYTHNLSVCYRCDTPLEPLPKLQWFIDVNKKFKRAGRSVSLKILMSDAVRSKKINIIPERFVKTYFHWIDNLRDWNISRQIWFGHQVPVWYRPTSVIASEAKQSSQEVYVGVEPPKGAGWTQDPDTLDTWFSSGLWTFSTLGWPDNTSDLKTFHPTSVLETGYDILFFWIARMVLMTTYLVGDVPFKTVYLHGLVRDEQGRKMSKSLGNIIDPLDVAEKFGTDAVRLSLVLGSAPGADSRLSEEKIAGFRNFTNKLWNISRFVISSLRGGSSTTDEAIHAKTLADRWILSRFNETARSVTEKIERFEFSSAGEELRDFTWNEFADWYLEVAKLQATSYKLQASTQTILLHLLEGTLKLWHPFMPFVTEAVWEKLSSLRGAKRRSNPGFLMVESWPEVSSKKADSTVMRDFAVVQEAVTKIRQTRANAKIRPAQKVDVRIGTGPKRKFLLENRDLICHLARLQSFTDREPSPFGGWSVKEIVSGTELEIYFSGGVVENFAERERLERRRNDLARYAASIEKKLGNNDFLTRAPVAVVASEQEKLAHAQEELGKLEAQLKVL